MAETKLPKSRRDTKPARGLTPSAALSLKWVALALAVITILFFHEVSLGGKTFVSPDAVAPAGFVRIGEQSLWHEHVYPLWNPFVFLGMPSFASGAYNPLIYPPDWPLGLLQKAVPVLPDMTWLLLYYFLGALFTYQLAREWGARAEGAFMGAVIFMFAPNLVAVGAHGHGSQLVDSAYLPLMVWLTARWLRRGSLSDLGWLGLAGGFQFLRGHVQICFYTWMAVGLYAGVEVLAAARDPKQAGAKVVRALALAVAAGLAFGVAGFYNLPLKDYAAYSVRSGGGGGGAGMDYATQWSMALYEWPAVFLPNWVGFGGGTYWGGMPFTDYPNAFVGIVAILLAIVALARANGAKGTARVFALVMGLFSVFVSFGHNFPLYGFLYDHVPLFNRFRIPVMIIILFQLAIAVGAAWGWSAILEAGRDPKQRDAGLERLLQVMGALLGVMLLAAVVGQDGLRSWYVGLATASKAQFPPDAAAAAFQMFAGDLLRVGVTGLVVIALAWFTVRGKLAPFMASLGVLVMLMFDLFPISTSVMQPVIGEVQSASLDVGRDDVVDWLQKQGPWGSFRTYLPENLRDNRLAGFGLATLNGYHAAKPRLFQDILDRTAPNGVMNSPRWWGLLNVRYVVLSRALPPEQTPPFLKLAFQGSQSVYENLTAMPRAMVVGAYGVVADTGTAAIDSITAGVHDPANFTWLTQAPGVTLGNVTGATATITKYGLHDVDIKVQTPGAGLLRLADLYYPDWTVTVDGQKAQMLRADHALRAVAVPAGEHQVNFHFASRVMRTGVTLSLVSVAAALLLLFAGVYNDRRRPPAAGPDEAGAIAAAAAGVL